MTDATALAGAIAAGRVDPSVLAGAVVEASHARATLGAIVSLMDEAGIVAAIREGVATGGPFGGVPMLAKDLGAPAAGLRQGVGSDALRSASACGGPGGRGASDAALPFRRARARRTVDRAGVRLRPVVGAARGTRGAQSLRRRPHARRVLGRGGGGGGGGGRGHRPWHRRGRVDPGPGGVLRALGSETLARGRGLGADLRQSPDGDRLRRGAGAVAAGRGGGVRGDLRDAGRGGSA
jgi:hypothetical protein